VGAPGALGLFNTGIPAVEVAAFEKWLVVSSPQIMWGTAIDLDERMNPPPPEKPVIVVIDLPAGKFYNTGLIGWRPDMARTPDGAVTIAFETDEECMVAPDWPQPPGGQVTGYPYMHLPPGGPLFGPGVACSQDANGDGDFSDRVIVLFTWQPPPGTPTPCDPAVNLCRGFTRIFAPPGVLGGVDVFTRASLSGSGTQGYLAHEHGLGDTIKENPATSLNFAPNIWLWDLSGLTSTPNVAAHPTRQFFAANGFPAPAVILGGGTAPPPPPPTIEGGYRPHVAARANASQSELLVYEQRESINFGVDLNGDGDQADYFLKAWSIVSPLQPCSLRLGHPRVSCGPASPFDIPITGIAPSLTSLYEDILQPEVNLTTTMDTVAGLPFLNPIPTSLHPRGTFFGDDAVRLDISFPGVVVYSRFEAPAVGQGSERELMACLDENVGFALPFLGTKRLFTGIPGRGLYPTGSGNFVTFVTREYASNVMTDLDGDGLANHSLIREIRFNPTTGTTAPTRTIACGYGPSLETNPGFFVGPTRVTRLTAFLTPEDCMYDLTHVAAGCPSAPGCTPYLIQGGSCLMNPPILDACGVGNLNPNLCFPAAYQDIDACDLVVRYELR
jgi:hypothetical protein